MRTSKAKIKFDIEIEDVRWNDIFINDFSIKIEQMLSLVMEKSLLQRYDNSFFFTIFCVDDKSIQSLNLQSRQIDRPTNVLSFPALDPKIFSNEISADCVDVGEIFLAYETIFNEAKEQKKKFEEHLMHLILHGFLHLIGYDHVKEDEAELMENLEQEVLDHFGIVIWD